MSEFSWVTLATNDSYSLGALVLAHSLKRVSTRYQLVVMVTPGVTQQMREKLAAVFDVLFEVNILDSKDERNLLLLQRPELGITFTKLHCWRLTQFKKCVFLDADTLVLQNCDELFERDEFSAAPDVGWPDCFNSGVFVYKPSDETFNSLLAFALQKGSFDGGDQGLLNLYFSDWAHKDISKHLPFIYNMCSTACYSYLPAFKQFGENVKIVHFIGNSKPWLQYFNSETLQVTPTPGFSHLQVIFDHWWNLFCAHVHSNLATSMSGLAGAFAQMTLREPKSASQGALEEHLRRQGWEAGRIDYLGQDSFDNVWKKICETISAAPAKEPSPPKELLAKQPSPPKQIVEQSSSVKEPSPPKQVVEKPVKEPSPSKQVEVQTSAPAAAPETTPAPVVAASESAPACPALPASAPEIPATLAQVAPTPVAPSPDVVAPVVSAPEVPVAPASETPAPVAPASETPAPVAPASETSAPVAPASETSAPVAPASETPAPVAPVPETPASVALVPETPASAAPVPETLAPVAPVSETPSPVAPTPETPTPVASSLEATTPEATVPVVHALETPAPVAPSPETPTPVAPISETPASVAPIPESKVASETESPAAPTPVPETTTPVVATESAASVAPIAEPSTPATPAAETVTAAPTTAAESVVAAPETTVATPATNTEAPKQIESKSEEQKPKEVSKSAQEAAAAPPTITETPATPQTPDASKGDIKPATAPTPAPAPKTGTEGQGQSSETPVPPPRKSGKNGGAQTKKSSKKK